jgi:hypothetical protein
MAAQRPVQAPTNFELVINRAVLINVRYWG